MEIHDRYGQSVALPAMPASNRADSDDAFRFELENRRGEQSAIKVLLIAPSLDIVGGQAVQAERLFQLFRSLPNLQVDFLPINPRLPGPLRRLQRTKYIRTVLTSGTFLGRLMATASQYDLIHCFSASNYSFLLSAAQAIWVGRLLGKKIIVNYRDGRATEHLSKWRTARLLRFADCIVTPSEYLVAVFDRYGYRAQSIYNVIDLKRFPFRQRKPVRPRFLHNRGLEELYNVPCTLKAFREVQQRYPNASLTVAHDGSLRRKLEQMVRDLELRNVRFTGTVSQSEAAMQYDAADIYLTSPNIDNMPGSLLECYASGLPVVATKAGGIPYIARHEETALLVDLNDHEGMARQAMRLIEEPRLGQRLAYRARQECARYSGSAIADQWLALYKKLSSTTSPRAPVFSEAIPG